MTDSASADRSHLGPGRLLRARIAVAILFFSVGTALGMWFVHIPLVVDRLRLEPALLGFILLSLSLGAMVAQTLAGVVMLRLGSNALCRALFWTPALVVTQIVAPSIPVLFAASIALGVMGGALVVAANTHAAEVEAAYGRPIMSSMHGFFSLGGLAAAVAGAVLIANGYGDGRGAAAVAAVLLAACLWAAFGVLPGSPPRTAAAPADGKGRRFALVGGAMALLAVTIFFANAVEGAVGDWSALYLTSVRQTDAAIAAAGYGMFSLAMVVSRFAGGPVLVRLGETRVIVGGGLLVIIGMLIVLLAPGPLVSAAGFLVVGIGAANIGPVLMSASTRVPGVAPSVGIAAMSLAQAGGMLLAPPVIGFIAQAAGLGTALWLLALCGIVVTVGGLLRARSARVAPVAPA